MVSPKTRIEITSERGRVIAIGTSKYERIEYAESPARRHPGIINGKCFIVCCG